MTDIVDSETLDCWRTNYGLDKSPHDLHDFWCDGAPPGAVLALKAAVAEIERLQAALAGVLAALDNRGGLDLSEAVSRANAAMKETP